MKKILFFTLACGMFGSAFTQIDTSKKIYSGYSDKWEIIKMKSKSSTGKLFVSLPQDAQWDMTIYASGSNKVRSNTMLKKEFSLLPGSYDVEINHIRINGVPVQKGYNTRIKAGVMHVPTQESWTLYDETGQTVLINTYSVQKRGLPVGKYILQMNYQRQAIEIKDGGTDFVPVDDLPDETDYYIVKSGGDIPDGKGRLYIDLELSYLEEAILTEPKYSLGIGPPSNNPSEVVPKDLVPGLYWIQFGGITPLFQVPIREGKKTRLKAGFLKITVDRPWKLNRVNGFNNVASATYSPPRTLALPPGQYVMETPDPDQPSNPNSKVFYDITIKDGGIEINGKKR